MKKKFGLILLGLIAVSTLAAGLAWADEDVLDAEKIAEMKGKELFKIFCKGCHTEESEAGEYTPMSLIQEQWEEFFDEEDGWTESHNDLVCPQAKEKKVTDTIDEEMLKKIRKFCIDHAADSEQPMTCG